MTARGAQPIRQYHKCDESKILPHIRLGIELSYIVKFMFKFKPRLLQLTISELKQNCHFRMYLLQQKMTNRYLFYWVPQDLQWYFKLDLHLNILLQNLQAVLFPSCWTEIYFWRLSLSFICALHNLHSNCLLLCMEKHVY